MDKQQYEKQKAAILQHAKQQLTELAKNYALANSKAQIGDIITDHYHTIKVTKVMAIANPDKPECYYVGIELKKDLTPTKLQKDTEMYESNIKRHIPA